MAREIPTFDDPDTVFKQNRALRALLAAQETALATLTAKGREYQEAITTLDSEREANARLTAELDEWRKDVADLHRVQHDGRRLLAKAPGGSSILVWAAEEIRALRKRARI